MMDKTLDAGVAQIILLRLFYELIVRRTCLACYVIYQFRKVFNGRMLCDEAHQIAVPRPPGRMRLPATTLSRRKLRVIFQFQSPKRRTMCLGQT